MGNFALCFSEISFISPLTVKPNSNTLFGSIIYSLYRIKGQNYVVDVLEKFKNGEPPFLISSIFPIKNNNYYFPKVILPFEKTEGLDSKMIKKIKKSQFIHQEILKTLLTSEKKVADIYKDFLNSNDYFVNIIKFDKTHNSIDRFTNNVREDGGLFFETSFVLNNAFFLILLVDFELDLLKQCIELGGRIGLGGNKSTGAGKYSVIEIKEVVDNKKLDFLIDYIKNDSKYFITLSPVIPKTDIDIDKSYYELEFYRGCVEQDFNLPVNNIWKKKVIYLKEGSVLSLKDNNEKFLGCCPIVHNEKEIIQYGYEFRMSLGV
ncbi:type III-A CRISPR-associated RAMP protein Csm4 [Deferribacter thermophilus]|uniref:type III-A CRISPR-associated RAMP protein Csm4 n=1 Tax=Deferribacter thermophilus TaxID=53573 RepID=UPI003C2A86CE